MDNVSQTPAPEENITTAEEITPSNGENTAVEEKDPSTAESAPTAEASLSADGEGFPAPDEKKRRIVRGVILAVLLVILIFSTVMILRYYRQQAEATKAQAEIEEQFISKPEPELVTPSEEEQQDETEEEIVEKTEESTPAATVVFPSGNGGLTVDFDALCAAHPDVVGYIYCPDTNISYAVLYGKGNDYYLYHDIDGNYNDNGSIFVEELNSGSFSDNNTILYGHHMKSGLMFANLTLYKNSSFYPNHPCMYLYTPTQDYRIDLYAGFVCAHDDEVYATGLTQDQLKAMAAKSTFTSAIDTPTGRTITMSTCSYEMPNGRYVVVGELVPID